MLQGISLVTIDEIHPKKYTNFSFLLAENCEYSLLFYRMTYFYKIILFQTPHFTVNEMLYAYLKDCKF